MARACSILQAHGLVVNESKTEGPAQSMTFLGLGLDSRDQVIFVPEDKVNELLQLSGNMKSREFTQRRHLQSLVGKFSFVAAALPGARPFFRKLIDASKGYKSPYSRIPMTADTREDLNAWATFLTKWNRRSRWILGSPFVLAHDASKSGFGFLLEEWPSNFDLGQLPARLHPDNGFAGYFSSHDLVHNVAKSIQWAELFAIVVSLSIYGPYLRDSHVHVKTDNITDVLILSRQSTTSSHLLPLLRSVYLACAHYNISLSVSHIPGVLNITPDHLSRPNLHQNRASCTHPHTNRRTHIHYIHSSSFRQQLGTRRPPTFCFPSCS
jgi:hypothetical protein